MVAFNSPLASYISNQDGYARTGVLNVKSQRPTNGFTVLLVAEESARTVALPWVNKNPEHTANIATNNQNLLCSLIALVSLLVRFRDDAL
jgi:hypothetical protein